MMVALTFPISGATERPNTEVDSQEGISRRIIGGQATSSNEYPWMVALVSSDTDDLTQAQFCGGTLIHPDWVLTAAHCVEEEIPGDVDVIIGGDVNAGRKRRRVELPERALEYCG
ncbi:MAG TPA: trypsin-like serine protease, partial [Verrucomicrobiales bacterium]|nr:trypsin-like serine protease [Verrucomicrobiales bacterium]